MKLNLPNKLTLLRVILIPLCMFFIVYPVFGKIASPIIAAVLFILTSLTDMLDGKIARKYNLVTDFGKFMDPLADKLLVYSAFCIFVEIKFVPAWMFIIILAREFAVAGIRTVAASTGKVIAAGITGKIKTVLQMICVLCLIMSCVVHDPFYIAGQGFLWGSLVMTVVSGTEYIVKNIDVFKS